MTELRGDGILIRPLEQSDARAQFELLLRNKDFLQPWEPRRTEEEFTIERVREWVASGVRDREADRAYAFGIFDVESDAMVGRVALSNVARGPWQNASIGYYVDEAHNGRGHATEAVRLAVRFAFRDAGLHRVQAAVMPRNVRSVRVVEKAGFRREGLAERYLEIDGRWEDHLIFAITVEETGSVR